MNFDLSSFLESTSWPFSISNEFGTNFLIQRIGIPNMYLELYLARVGSKDGRIFLTVPGIDVLVLSDISAPRYGS